MELRPNHQFDPYGPGADAYYTDEAADVVNNIDWDDPSSFFKAIGAGPGGSMPMPEMKSAPDVRREATARSAKIFTSYETLREILQRHEATIRKRWIKKTRASKAENFAQCLAEHASNASPRLRGFPEGIRGRPRQRY